MSFNLTEVNKFASTLRLAGSIYGLSTRSRTIGLHKTLSKEQVLDTQNPEFTLLINIYNENVVVKN